MAGMSVDENTGPQSVSLSYGGDSSVIVCAAF